MSKPQSPQASSGRPADNVSRGSKGEQSEALDRLGRLLVPFELHFFPELASTNDTADQFAREGSLNLPAIVTTARQTAGRGTRGRRWHALGTGLAATFALPIDETRPIHHLPILAGLAVRDALTQLAGNDAAVTIKWSNDVLLNGGKVSGVLCERVNGVDLIGVGVNITRAPAEPEEVTSYAALADVRPGVEVNNVLRSVAEEMTRRLISSPPAVAWREALDEWRRHDALLGRTVVVETPSGEVTGRANGIDAEGRLCVVREDGVAQPVVSGSIRSISG